jgi:hypothetical protein
MSPLHGGNGRARNSRASRQATGPCQNWRPLLHQLETRCLPGFLAPLAFDAGQYPFSVAVGDFNGDGIPDLAVANAASNNVSVLLGNGDGTFQAPRNFPAGSGPRSVAVGDFNGDGILDLAVVGYDQYYHHYDETVRVLLGNGDGSFQAPRTFNAGSGPLSVAIGDFNGDGVQDLAVANWGDPAHGVAGGVSVLLGNGDGSFQAPLHLSVGTIGQPPESVAVGDFNGDGIQDLAVGSSERVSVLLGNGDGTFQNSVNYTGPFFNNGLVVADLNGDGVPDLATTGGNTVNVLVGNGDGTFHRPVTYYDGTINYSVAVGDFNGDGVPDLAVAGYGDTVSVLLGNGDGTFQAAVHYHAGTYYAFSVAAADFNGDGWPDLAVTNNLPSHVSILLNDADWSGASPGASSGRRFPDSVAGMSPSSTLRSSAALEAQLAEAGLPDLPRPAPAGAVAGTTAALAPRDSDRPAPFATPAPALRREESAPARARPAILPPPLLDRLFTDLATAPAWGSFPAGLDG